MINPKRVRLIKEGIANKGPIVYWMQRDQRVYDNWALLYAQELAIKNKTPLLVVFCLQSRFLNAAVRQFDFMLNGLREVEEEFFIMAGVEILF